MHVKKDSGLLRQLERDALGAGALAEALRRCMVLGGKMESPDLREWAAKELRGYSVTDELPDHREVAAPICIDATTPRWQVTAQPIARSALPDAVQSVVGELAPIRFGVGEIEAMVKNHRANGDASVLLALPHAADVCRLMNHEIGNPYQNVSRIYWTVALSALEGVVDQVRTSLAELVSELTAGLPAGEDLPTSDVVSQAVSVAIKGKRNRVTLTAPQASGGSSSAVTSSQPAGFWTLQRQIAALVAGAASILGAVLASHQVWGWPF
jgi:hypothetical protein